MSILKQRIYLGVLVVLLLGAPFLIARTAMADVQSSSLTIALVDSGIDYTHSDLKNYLVDGTNLLNPNLSPMDDNGHGTNVAGVIVSVAQKNSTLSGIPWNIQLMPIKALESDGSGDEEHLGQGIQYAIDNGARIVVLSLGLNKYSSYLSGIVQSAEDHGAK